MGDSFTFGNGVVETTDTYPYILERLLNEGQNEKRVKVFNFGVSAYNVKTMAATLEYRMLALEPDLVIMAIISDNFNLSRTGDVDKWGYTISYRLSGYVDKDSIFKLMLRKVHLAYLLRDTRSRFLGYSRQFFADEKYRIVLLPNLNQEFGIMIDQFQTDQITFFDLSYIRDEFTLEDFKASRFDAHPSAMVHNRLAEVLAHKILEAHLLLD